MIDKILQKRAGLSTQVVDRGHSILFLDSFKNSIHIRKFVASNFLYNYMKETIY